MFIDLRIYVRIVETKQVMSMNTCVTKCFFSVGVSSQYYPFLSLY